MQQAQAEATVLAKLQVEAHKERNDFRSESVDADETRERQAAAGVVRAGGCGGRRDADRLREFVELAAGARHDAAKRNCDSRDARSGEDAADPADADGEFDSVVLRSDCRADSWRSSERACWRI